MGHQSSAGMAAPSRTYGKTRRPNRISPWIKVPYTAFVIVLVPIYALQHGPQNFLWFSDVALLVLVVALWRESALLFSLAAVGYLLPELAWEIDFLLAVLLGGSVLHITGYMFDEPEPLYLRGLSLFHLLLPPVMLWGLYSLGYDRRALLYQTPVTWVLLLASYLLTDPADNINWVFGIGAEPQDLVDPLLYLGVMIVAVPLLLHVPAHLVPRHLFRPPGEPTNRSATG